MLRRLYRDDSGQLLLLVLCYAVIAALLITVVINVSKAHLYRRALVAAADGAALAAANAADVAEVYRSSAAAPEAVLLAEPAAKRAVEDYAAKAQLGSRFNGFEVVDVEVTGSRVTVTLTASVRMPILNLLSAQYENGYAVHASATARSPLEP